MFRLLPLAVLLNAFGAGRRDIVSPIVNFEAVIGVVDKPDLHQRADGLAEFLAGAREQLAKRGYLDERGSGVRAVDAHRQPDRAGVHRHTWRELLVKTAHLRMGIEPVVNLEP